MDYQEVLMPPWTLLFAFLSCELREYHWLINAGEYIFTLIYPNSYSLRNIFGAFFNYDILTSEMIPRKPNSK